MLKKVLVRPTIRLAKEFARDGRRSRAWPDVENTRTRKVGRYDVRREDECLFFDFYAIACGRGYLRSGLLTMRFREQDEIL